MLLFHVNRDTHNIEEFNPRTPQMSICEEEVKDKRICVSESIDGCFSAVIFGGHELKYSMFLNEYYDDDFDEETDEGKHAKFKLYVFDTEDINSDNLIDFKTLDDKILVADAFITKEYWVLNQSLVPRYILEIEVHDFELVKTEYKRLNGEVCNLAHNSNLKGKITSCLENKNGKFKPSLKYVTEEIIHFSNYFEVVNR